MSGVIDLGDAAAFTSPDWLPEASGIEWLDSLGADHRRLLGAYRGAMAAHGAAVDARDRALVQRREALALAVRTDRDADVPDAATVERRAQEVIAAAEEQTRAAADALRGFVADVVAAVEERGVEWLGLLASRRDVAAEKRAEAERLLAEAAAVEAGVWHLEEWVTRNAKLHQRPSFRNVPAARFLTWTGAQELRPPVPPSPDGMPTLLEAPPLPRWDGERAAGQRDVAERIAAQARTAEERRAFAADHADRQRAIAEAEAAADMKALRGPLPEVA
jgi:hypothetical protein